MNMSSPSINYTANPTADMIPSDTETCRRRSLISLSSSSSASRDNDESVPVIQTGGSFISYSTEGIATLKTKSDFYTDSENLVSTMSYLENPMHSDLDVEQPTRAAIKEELITTVASGRRRKGFWSRIFRRSGRRGGDKTIS